MTSPANAIGAPAQSKSDKSVEFGADQLKANAAVYHANKRIMDAASSYDSLDDAIAGLEQTWNIYEDQVEKGGRFTPDRSLGFGSDNASVIAESVLGRRNTVGATRKALNKLGK